MHRANTYASIRIYTEIVVCALNHEEVATRSLSVYYGKGSVCVVRILLKQRAFKSDFGE